MIYDETNHICTKNNEIVVGNEYLYSEDHYKCKCKVLKDNSDDEFMRFTLEWLEGDFSGRPPTEISGRKGFYGYSGMWTIWDVGSVAMCF